MKQVDSKYYEFIDAVLRDIRRELDRLYWNKNQKQMDSPFDNTGAPEYSNDTFKVRSYDWDMAEESEDSPPNFEYKTLKLWWYKYQGRGTYVVADEDVTPEFIYQMYTDCMKALKDSEEDYE